MSTIAKGLPFPAQRRGSAADDGYDRPGRRAVTVSTYPFPSQRQPHWSEQAACQGQTALFAFEDSLKPPALSHVERAVSICETCPVRVACRTSTIAAERAYVDVPATEVVQNVSTIAGGLTPFQRHPTSSLLCIADDCAMPPWHGRARTCVTHARTHGKFARVAAASARAAARRARREQRLAELEAREAAS